MHRLRVLSRQETNAALLFFYPEELTKTKLPDALLSDENPV